MNLAKYIKEKIAGQLRSDILCLKTAVNFLDNVCYTQKDQLGEKLEHQQLMKFLDNCFRDVTRTVSINYVEIL